MVFPNPGFFLKPGMFATVENSRRARNQAVLVPDMAIMRSGEQNTVFVAHEGGKFEPRQVDPWRAQHGRHLRGAWRIGRGRDDCYVRPIPSRFGKPAPRGRSKNAGSPAAPALPASSPAEMEGMKMATPEPERTAYVCPMPEHASILYNAPGTCPICGHDARGNHRGAQPRAIPLQPCSRQSLSFRSGTAF